MTAKELEELSTKYKDLKNRYGYGVTEDFVRELLDAQVELCTHAVVNSGGMGDCFGEDCRGAIRVTQLFGLMGDE